MNNSELLVVLTGPTGPAVSQSQNEILISTSANEIEIPADLKPLKLVIS
jgi:hypothetical protein